jgi:hypothetical protein
MKKSIITTIAICLISIISTAQTWSSVGTGLNGLNGTVNALHTDSTSNRLYATGTFSGNVAYWDGSAWNIIPHYPGHFAGLSLTTYGTNLIVGSDSIYVYDGSTWTTVQGLGTGTKGISNNYGFYSLCTYPACNTNGFIDFICAGGNYTAFNGFVSLDPNNSYAFYQIGINFGPGYYGTFTDLKLFKDTIYAVGPQPGYVGKFTGGRTLTQVTTTTVSTTDYVNHANVYGNEIYFTGSFATFAGVTSPVFIGYTGSSFVGTGGGASGVMQTYNNNLYISSSTSPGIKIWNGTSLSNITSQIGQTINCMAVYNGELYCGGNFTTPFANIAKYNDNTATTGIAQNESSISVSVYPNPTNGKFNVHVNGEATVDIINVVGQVVNHVNINGTQSISVNEPGVYTMRVIQNGKLFTSRLINQ